MRLSQPYEDTYSLLAGVPSKRRRPLGEVFEAPEEADDAPQSRDHGARRSPVAIAARLIVVVSTLLRIQL